jgi:hypothetical protein
MRTMNHEVTHVPPDFFPHHDMSLTAILQAEKDMQANREFLLGQLDGSLLSVRLWEALKGAEPLDASRLLPDLSTHSNEYKNGFKSMVVEKIFPQAIRLFHHAGRSTRERLQLMDEILRHLRAI